MNSALIILLPPHTKMEKYQLRVFIELFLQDGIHTFFYSQKFSTILAHISYPFLAWQVCRSLKSY